MVIGMHTQLEVCRKLKNHFSLQDWDGFRIADFK